MRDKLFVIGLATGLTFGICLSIVYGSIFWPKHYPHLRDVPLPGDAFVVSAIVVQKRLSPALEVMVCPSGPIAGPVGFMVHDAEMWEQAEIGAFIPIAIEKESSYFGDAKWIYHGFLGRGEAVE